MSNVKQKQIERIEYFEKLLDGAGEALSEYKAAREAYEAAGQRLKAAKEKQETGTGCETASTECEAASAEYEAASAEYGEAGESFAMAGQAFMDIQRSIWELSAYYGSQDWWDDFHASENGELPDDLKCGVLSEDGVYDVLSENDELLKQM